MYFSATGNGGITAMTQRFIEDQARSFGYNPQQMSTTINNIDEDFANVQTQITAIQAIDAQQDSSILTLTNQVIDIQAKDSAQDSSLTNLQNQITNLQTQITTLKTQVQTQTNKFRVGSIYLGNLASLGSTQVSCPVTGAITSGVKWGYTTVRVDYDDLGYIPSIFINFSEALDIVSNQLQEPYVKSRTNTQAVFFIPQPSDIVQDCTAHLLLIHPSYMPSTNSIV